MEAEAETHSWLRCREHLSVERSATNETSGSPGLSQGSENVMKEGVERLQEPEVRKD